MPVIESESVLHELLTETITLPRHPEPLRLVAAMTPRFHNVLIAFEPDGTVAGRIDFREPVEAHGEEFNFIDVVRVPERLQRRGIATALWQYAERLDMNPCHSDDLSEDGAAWVAGMEHKAVAA